MPRITTIGAPKGQQTMANSVAVVWASDQSQQTNPTSPTQVVSTPFTDIFRVFEFNFSNGDNKLFWYESLTGAGTSSINSNEACLTLTNTTASGDKVTRQTQRHLYQIAVSQTITLGMLVGAKKTNVKQRWGSFDERDGFFFEQDSTNLKIVIRTYATGSAVDTAVNQSAWSVDKLDGTGTSGITLDTSKINNYIINYVWDGGLFVRYGIVSNGIVYYCHKIDATNIDTAPEVTRPNLPIRAELENTGAAASSTSMKIYAVSNHASSPSSGTGVLRAIDLGVTGRTTTGTLTPIMALRLKSANYRGIVSVKSINLALGTNQVVYYVVYYNPSLTAASFTAVPGTNTLTEYDISATAISGGDIILSGYTDGSSGGNNVSPVDITGDLKLSSNIAGTTDIVCLAAQKVSGTSPTTYASMLFAEYA